MAYKAGYAQTTAITMNTFPYMSEDMELLLCFSVKYIEIAVMLTVLTP